MFWQTSSGRISLEEPFYLGILNLTPDSFSDGGSFQEPTAALLQANHLVAQGAGTLDIGGESTRPGAQTIDSTEEWRRVEPTLKALRQESPSLPLSLDSRHASVASKGLECGVAILNDVSGFADPAMLELASKSPCGLIAMRSREAGGKLVMPPYENPTPRDASAALAELRRVKQRLLAAGIAPERILLDPGFGFGTTFQEDHALWKALPQLAEVLDWPVERICIGISRKRFLAARANRPELLPTQRDDLTEEAHAEARRLGFKVFRTHAMPSPKVRSGEPSDAAAIAKVHVASWREAYKGMLPATLLENLSASEKESLALQALRQPESSGHRVLVLDRGGQLLGFAALGATDPEGKTAEIFAIYLHPACWGQGLGRLLLASALNALRQDGFHKATLWVLERNARARAFYEAGGWKPTGGTRTQWHGGIAMRELSYGLDI